MFIHNISVSRLAAALVVAWAVIFGAIPSASAGLVQFNYSGEDTDTIATGSFTIESSLFNGSASQSISQSFLQSFSFSMTNKVTNAVGTWGFGNLITTSTLFFDSTVAGVPDVVGAGGSAAGGPSGGLSFAGTGSVLAQSAFGSISSANGDWQVSVVPLPAALPLYGTGLAVMGLIGWRRKRKAARAQA